MGNNNTLAARLWRRVDRSGDCWLWTGATFRNGYGYLNQWVDGRWKHGLAHRVMWELVHGPVPEGMNVLHSCDVRACVRPDHLHLGTQSENIQEMDERGRRNPAAIPRGERNGNAVLTDADVQAIRTAYTGRHGEKAALGRRYGVSAAAIGSILRGRGWKHVRQPETLSVEPVRVRVGGSWDDHPDGCAECGTDRAQARRARSLYPLLRPGEDAGEAGGERRRWSHRPGTAPYSVGQPSLVCPPRSTGCRFTDAPPCAGAGAAKRQPPECGRAGHYATSVAGWDGGVRPVRELSATCQRPVRDSHARVRETGGSPTPHPTPTTKETPTVATAAAPDVFDPRARPGPRTLTRPQIADALVRLSFAVPHLPVVAEEREPGVPTMLAYLPSGTSVEATYDAGSWWVNLNDADGVPLGEEGPEPMGFPGLVHAIRTAYEVGW